MATPTRFPSGVSNAASWQFFSDLGTLNPFFYHEFWDDFDITPSQMAWTTTAATGTASLAAAADGGVITLSTTAANNDFVALCRPVAGFSPIAGKRTYFAIRFSLSDVLACNVVAGLIPVTATIFTPPSNGIWISKATGTTQLVLNVANNGTTTTTNLPTAGYSLTNNTTIDVGFLVSGTSGTTITASAGPNLVGYVPPSGTASANSTNRYPNIVSSAPLLTTLQGTVLAPAFGVQATAAAIKRLSCDFIGAFRER